MCLPLGAHCLYLQSCLEEVFSETGLPTQRAVGYETRASATGSRCVGTVTLSFAVALPTAPETAYQTRKRYGEKGRRLGGTVKGEKRTAGLGCLLGGGNSARYDDGTIRLNDQYQQPHLDGGDVLGLHALSALGRLVGDLLAFFEGLEPAARYPAEVHEKVLASVVGHDEAVALVAVEPLDRSLGHVPEPAFHCFGVTAAFDCGGNILE